jgi:hypothetical protein
MKACYFIFTLVALVVGLPVQAGFECRREKGENGELVTKCSQNGESQIKVKVEGEMEKQPVRDPGPDDEVPPELAEEIRKSNEASMLDWPCSTSRAPEITLMPETKNGTRQIGISGTYKSASCGNVELAFPTGLGTVVLDCGVVSLRLSGQMDLCVTAHDITSRAIDLAKGRVYLRGTTSGAYLNIEMPDDRGSSQRFIFEKFGSIADDRELYMRGSLRILGSPEAKTQLKNLTMLAGALSLENVSANRVTVHKGVKLYLKNSDIHNLRWVGPKAKPGKPYSYLGPISH